MVGAWCLTMRAHCTWHVSGHLTKCRLLLLPSQVSRTSFAAICGVGDGNWIARNFGQLNEEINNISYLTSLLFSVGSTVLLGRARDQQGAWSITHITMGSSMVKRQMRGFNCYFAYDNLGCFNKIRTAGLLEACRLSRLWEIMCSYGSVGWHDTLLVWFC